MTTTQTDLPPVIARLLEPGEWVVVAARLHWSVYLPALAVSWVWGALYLWAGAHGFGLLALVALVVLVVFVPALFLWAIWRRRSSFALLTNRRVIMVAGPVPLRVRALACGRIDEVRVRWSLLGRLLGAGAVDIVPLDRDAPILSMNDLARPERFAQAVRAAAGVPVETA